jgi:hypothetical protein
MPVDFGRVEKYFADRGFGFITHTFANGGNRHVFFHITTINKLNSAMAKVLDREIQAGSVYFWYRFDIATKGEQVIEALDVRDITECEKLLIIKQINETYSDIRIALSDGVEAAAEDLLNENDISDLVIARNKLEAKKKELEDQQQRESEAKHRAYIEKQAAQRKLEEDEFNELVIEISSLGFTETRQVSSYIVNKQLGYKYPNISGVLEMELDGRTWNYDGGFPKMIYARLCKEIGLSNQGTRAKPGRFISYKVLGR